MDKNMKNLDDLFEEGLGNYTEVPPAAAWAAFEKKLSAVPHRGGRFTYRRLLLLAVAGLFVVSIPAMKFLPVFNMENNTRSTLTSENENTPVNANNSDGRIVGQVTNSDTKQNTGKEATTDVHNNGDPNRQPGQPQRIAQNIIKERYIPGHNQKTIRNTSKHNSIGNEQNEEPENRTVYQSSLSNPAAIDQTDENNENNDSNSSNKPTAEPKEESVPDKTEQKAIVNVTLKNSPKPPKPKLNRWETGIKAGYERGFNNDAGRKILVSPYLQYNISRKFSIMFQPAIKGGEIANRRIGNISSYSRQNADSSCVQIGPADSVSVITRNELYITRYRYTQSHDSIAKAYSIGGNYLECEMPLLFKYNVNKTFSVYAGVNLLYSKQFNVKEQTYIEHKSTTKDTLVITRTGQTANPYPVSSIIKYPGSDYSGYSGPAYAASGEAIFRAGYMIGISYEFHKRLLFDALVQQSNARSNVQGGYNVNTALSAPYFRFTIGYKLSK